ncbi:MAG: hypothetical protein O7J95_10785 [Planctomycetota bacterium]|nr:hypothetical protein [Planctomycetota bacterium]
MAETLLSRTSYSLRGFLPEEDPVGAFPPGSELAVLDELGRDLPSLLEDPGFRRHAEELRIPEWPEDVAREETLGELRLYYVRLGFLASAYVNQVSQERATRLPATIAVPFCKACRFLDRPPILSYDGYALYNWKRFDRQGPIALGNIDTLQNFVHLYDEHWFIMVHVEIETLAGRILAAIPRAQDAVASGDRDGIDAALQEVAEAVRGQVDVLRRIPQKMDPATYYRTFRPYIRFFDNVVYEGVAERPMNHRGETGAQSSILPLLVGFLKIPHERSLLTDHLRDMRRFMPAEHRELLEEVEAGPCVRELAAKDAFNDVIDAVATFREVHYGWAREYIDRRVDDPRGTGGTPYMKWLEQIVDETKAHRKK